MTEPTRPPWPLFAYELPWGSYQLDTEVAAVVVRINESGWVWTAESCSGHDEEPWTEPFLRLVVPRERAGELLWLLQVAWHRVPEGLKPFYSICPCPEGIQSWAVLIVRLSPVFGTDRGPAMDMLKDLSDQIVAAK